jgi:hypothetical protein
MTSSRSRRPRALRFSVRREGYTMYLVTFLSEAARQAARPLFGADAVWLGRSVAVDHRYVEAVVDGLVRRDGFTLVETSA